MQQTYPFQPRDAGNTTAQLAVGAATAVLPLPAIQQEGGSVRLVNSGTQVVFLSFAGAAALTSMPMLAGTVEVFSLPPGTVISAISAATGSILYGSIGDGA